MRVVRVAKRAGLYYLAATAVLAILLGEVLFHPERVPIRYAQSAAHMAATRKVALRDVSITAADGARMQAWFMRPANANNNAVILLHGIGDNREGMMSYAEFLLERGYMVL